MVIFLFLFFFEDSLVFASNPPLLIEPLNNSITSDTSPKLSWQFNDNCTKKGGCFRVEVSDSENFNSLEKDTYTNNTYYTPQNLLSKKYYWRVKAKDTSNNWSSYSEVWSFEISSNNQDSTPQPTNQLESSPSPSNNTPSNFNISSVPPSLNATSSFNINIEAINLKPSTNYYLKGAFIKEDSSNYFGKTLVNGSWIKNNESYTKQFLITTDNLGSWTGSITCMVDIEDSGFLGNGNYIFKVARYNSSSPSWSDEHSINIVNFTPTETESPKKSNSTSKPKITKSPAVSTPIPSIKLTKSIVNKNFNKPSKSLVSTVSAKPKIASIAGTATESPSKTNISQTRVEEKVQYNWYLILGGFIFLISGLFTLVKMIKRN